MRASHLSIMCCTTASASTSARWGSATGYLLESARKGLQPKRGAACACEGTRGGGVRRDHKRGRFAVLVRQTVPQLLRDEGHEGVHELQTPGAAHASRIAARVQARWQRLGDGGRHWSRHSHKQARAEATADGDDGASAEEKNTPLPRMRMGE